jgi:hypothetical protein
MILFAKVIKNTGGGDQVTGRVRMAQGLEGCIKSDSQWMLSNRHLAIAGWQSAESRAHSEKPLF